MFRLAAAVSGVALLAGSLTACTVPSADSFCTTIGENQALYNEQLEVVQSGDFEEVAESASEMEGLTNMWTALESSAPSEIEEDVTTVASAWTAIEAAAEDGDYLTIGSEAYAAAPSFTAINEYVGHNCQS